MTNENRGTSSLKQRYRKIRFIITFQKLTIKSHKQQKATLPFTKRDAAAARGGQGEMPSVRLQRQIKGSSWLALMICTHDVDARDVFKLFLAQSRHLCFSESFACAPVWRVADKAILRNRPALRYYAWIGLSAFRGVFGYAMPCL